jgi:hypothetical protein
MSNIAGDEMSIRSEKEGARKKYSTFDKNQFIAKILLVIVSVYFAIALGFVAISPYNYTRQSQNFTHWFGTVLTQPIYELTYGGKISRPYDWKQMDSSVLDQELPLTQIRPSTNRLKFDSPIYQKAFSQIQGNGEAVIVKPENDKVDWVLNTCYRGDRDAVCVKSNLITQGSVRFLLRDESNIWGETLDGKKIKLTIVRYIKTDESRDLLLI